MIKAIALDDEPLPLRLLKSFAVQVDFLDLIATFTSPVEAKKFIEHKDVDLIFLDIQMPGISGIDFLKALPKGIMVIFTTAFGEYAVEGFNLQAVDYLLKPFELDRFVQAAERARDFFAHKNPDAGSDTSLYVKADHGIVKIAPGEILYIEGLNNYLKIFLLNKKPLLVRMSVKDMADKLMGKGFMRVHRSYIIPVAKVVSVRNRMIYLGYMEIPIGINYIKDIYKTFGNKL